MTDQRQEVTHCKLFHQEESLTGLASLQTMFIHEKHTHKGNEVKPWEFISSKNESQEVSDQKVSCLCIDLQ